MNTPKIKTPSVKTKAYPPLISAVFISSASLLASHSVLAESKNITNLVFSQSSPSCSDYANDYKATAKDIHNDTSFNGKVKISVSDGRCNFESNAIPNHDFNDGKSTFRHKVSEQNHVVSITDTPSLASENTALSISYDNAIFLNGVKLDLLAAACYGEGEGGLGKEKIGCFDLADGKEHPWRYDPESEFNDFGTDSHHAHPQPNGAYHYHAGPQVLFEANCESTKKASAVIGFAADGFPIYGSCYSDKGTVKKATSSYVLKSGARQAVEGFTTPDKAYIVSDQYDGQFRGDYEYVEGKGSLDECNGMMVDGNYGYYATDSYPWVINCFKGTPDSSFVKPKQ